MEILRTDLLESKGGTAILTKRHLPTQSLTLPPLQLLEATEAKFLTTGLPIILIAAYKQPNNRLIIEDISKLSHLGTKILIVEHLNSKHQFWI